VIWIGTSGWQYRDWRGTFYPKDLRQREWLTFYAQRFPTVEVNNSFYRLPEAETFRHWAAETPEGFVVTVKVSRFLTHLKRLRDPEEPLQRLLERARELGPKLGPLLFQLPPRFPAAPDRLRELLARLPDDVVGAFEFRDPSWYRDEVYALLEEANAPLVWPDRPGPSPDLPLIGDRAYVRFHQGRRTGPAYDPRKLRRWADRIAALPVRDAWIYFNNDQGGAAPHDALELTHLVEDRVGERVVTTSAAR